MDTPRLTVLMTVYNGRQYLSPTIESILHQTFSDFELFIVDDGSNDGTWSVVTSYAAQDSRLKLLRNESNLGITRSMNKLFALAKGEYVTRHDADDISFPERFAYQVDFLDSHEEIGLIGAWVEIVDAQGVALEGPGFFPSDTDNQTIQRQLLMANCLGQGAVMFRRRCLELVGFYDETLEYTEDYDLWLRLAEVTQLAKLPMYLYQYRQHAGSVSQVRYSLQMLHLAQTLEKAAYRRQGPSPDTSSLTQTVHCYLRAAEVYQAQGDVAVASRCMARAITLCPRLFEVDDLETPIQLTEAGLSLAEQTFSQLPTTRRLAWLKSSLIARLHMREVFMGVQLKDDQRIDDHVWLGLRHNPWWLLNTGVIAIVFRVVGRQIRKLLGREGAILPKGPSLE